MTEAFARATSTVILMELQLPNEAVLSVKIHEYVVKLGMYVHFGNPGGSSPPFSLVTAP